MNNDNHEQEQNKTDDKSVISVIKQIFSKKWVWYVIIGMLAVIVTSIAISLIISAAKKPRENNGRIDIPPAFETKVEVTKIAVKIENIIKQSNLSVLSFPFEGTVEWTHGEDKVGFINYAGYASIGIDFGNVEVDEPNQNNEIIIHVPKVKVTSYSTEKSKFKYIYTSNEMKKTYGTQSYEGEAYSICNNNMLDHISSNEYIKDTAQKYVSDLIHALTDSILEAEGLKCVIEIGG